jgi:hypothetical protein
MAPDRCSLNISIGQIFILAGAIDMSGLSIPMNGHRQLVAYS